MYRHCIFNIAIISRSNIWNLEDESISFIFFFARLQKCWACCDCFRRISVVHIILITFLHISSLKDPNISVKCLHGQNEDSRNTEECADVRMFSVEVRPHHRSKYSLIGRQSMPSASEDTTYFTRQSDAWKTRAHKWRIRENVKIPEFINIQ